MTLIPLHERGNTPFQQLLGYNASILKYWNKLSHEFEKDGRLPAKLKEEVRVCVKFYSKGQMSGKKWEDTLSSKCTP